MPVACQSHASHKFSAGDGTGTCRYFVNLIIKIFFSAFFSQRLDNSYARTRTGGDTMASAPTPSSVVVATPGSMAAMSAPDSEPTKRIRSSFRADLTDIMENERMGLLPPEEARDDRKRARERYQGALDERMKQRVAAVACSKSSQQQHASSSDGEEASRITTRVAKVRKRFKKSAKRVPQSIAELKKAFQEHMDASTSTLWYKEVVDEEVADGYDEEMGKHWAAAKKDYANHIVGDLAVGGQDVEVWYLNAENHAVCSICDKGGNPHHEHINIEVG